MTIANRARVLKWVGLSEGGYVNNANDPGGPTMKGITQRSYDADRRQRGLPVQSVQNITAAEVADILVARYFAPVGFDDLPSGLDYAMADYSTNSGPARAVKELQAILGVPVDGIMGPQTLDAIADRDPEDLIIELCNRRLAFMKRAKHPKTGKLLWATFGKGWQARVMGRTEGVQAADIGVIDRAVLLARSQPLRADHSPPTTEAPGKAPEAAPEGAETIPTAVGAGGAVAAAGGLVSALGSLHPIVQGIAVAGALLAAAALFYIWRKRGLRL